jgi:thiamine-monophosphate kinase
LCKGVKPKYYFISASGNKQTFNKKNLKKISKSLNEEQRKYKIILGGGDTVFSNKLSFTITSIGFTKEIIFRNKAKVNDDIYVSGNIGDSYSGLLVLRNKLKISNIQKKYFINKYYKPDLNVKLSNKLISLASSSIDISDGLFTDLEKLLINIKLPYKIYLTEIPISKILSKILNKKKLKKLNFVSNGDDYQILFTAPKINRLKIKKLSKSNGIRITRIGKILNTKQRSVILDDNLKPITLKNKGYFHRF